MDSFTLKCIRCGKEITIYEKDANFDSSKIKIFEDVIRETVIIQCECGNKAEFY
jgi:DNA-directed RNA polymerase subunit RPC12/RpoP